MQLFKNKRWLPFALLTPALFFTVSIWVKAQETSEFSFSLLRQNDQIEAFQSNPTSAYQKAKVAELGKSVSLLWGGSVRWQYERFQNENFDAGETGTDGWMLHRAMFHTDLKLGNKWRVFGELNNSLTWKKENLSPVDEDELGMNQFFIQFQTEKFSFLIGRENLNLGGRRLVDLREGPNVRRSFDVMRTTLKTGKWTTLLFYGIPVYQKRGIFDNEDLHAKEGLWGVYGVKNTQVKSGFDLYYLGFRKKNKTYFAEANQEEIRHSIGGRWWGKKNRWNYNHEALAQFGSFGDQSIWAWTASVNADYKLTEKQTIGFKTELISGDSDASDNRLGTFNPLYPRGAYFGRVAKFGPSNLIDIHPYWAVQGKKLRFEIDYDAFWRFSTADGIYGPAVTPDFAPDGNSRFIAHQFGTLLTWEQSPFFAAELETNYIVPGDYLKDVTFGDQLFHLVITAEFKF